MMQPVENATPALDGAWEPAFSVGPRVEIDGHTLIRLWRGAPVLETEFELVPDGERLTLTLTDNALRYSASSEPYATVKECWYENGALTFVDDYPISGESTEILVPTTNGRYGNVTELGGVEQLQGTWVEDGGGYTLVFEDGVMRYGYGDSAPSQVEIKIVENNSSGQRRIIDADPSKPDGVGIFGTMEWEGDTIRTYLPITDTVPERLVFRKLRPAELILDVEPEDQPEIIIVRETEPDVTGGTDTTLDPSMPSEIVSTQMTLFDVTSVLPDGADGIGFVSAFAAPAGKGSFLFLETGDDRGERSQTWALVPEDVFPALSALTAACDLAANNGYHSETHGLPENFGGIIRILYASGEMIYVSDNQSPVLTAEAGEQIAAFFAGRMGGERVPLPDPVTLRAIRFEETRDDGGFTRAVLTISEDGSGQVEKQSSYSDPTVYETSSEMDAATVAAIRERINASGILAWAGLPDNGIRFSWDKQMTFVFADATEITVQEDRLLPDQIHGGFFDIELEIVSKR